jgi:HPr kinase/phosphorylase
MLLHGSCAALDGEAVLLLSPPGGGKSDLLLRLLGRGWRLVADDQVALVAGAEGLTASPPEALAGAMEVRGLGLLAGLDWATAPLRLVARLVARAEVPRLPEPEPWREAGPTLPLLRLDPFAASAPDLLAMALRVLRGGALLRAGALRA